LEFFQSDPDQIRGWFRFRLAIVIMMLETAKMKAKITAFRLSSVTR